MFFSKKQTAKGKNIAIEESEVEDSSQPQDNGYYKGLYEESRRINDLLLSEILESKKDKEK